MIRYQIRFDKPGRIFNPRGLAERIVAFAATDHGRIVVYVADQNRVKFEDLLEGEEHVVSYVGQHADR